MSKELSSTIRVLVIEDDHDEQVNLNDILRMDGHELVIVETASEALDRNDWESYAAIILDWTLPDGTAENLLPQLRDRCPDASILVITGTVGLHGTITAIRHEVADYILKPLDGDDLRTSVRRIAERRELLIDKARSEAAFRALVEAAPSAIMIFRPDRSVVYFNPYATQVTGYRTEEIVGRDFLPLLVRDSAMEERVDAEIKAVLAGRKTRGFEQPVWCKDETLRWFVWNGQRLDDYAGAVAVLAVGLDITERRIAEQRLQAEHAVARLLAESPSVDDAAPRLLQAICENLGWERGEWWCLDSARGFLRCSATWFRPTPNAWAVDETRRDLFVKPGMGLVGQTWESQKPTLLDEVKSPEPAIHPSDFQSGIGCPVLLNETILAAMVFFSRDREVPNAELRSSVTSLGRRIGQFLGRKQAEARAQEAERYAAIAEAMDALIHEGRNALQRSQACIEMLGIEVENLPEARRLLGRVQIAQDHLLSLYEQVRDFAAPVTLDLKDHNLGQILRDAWNAVAKANPDRTARLSDRDGGLRLHALVDGVEFKRVFQNVIENAFAASTGSVEIDVEWSSVEHEGRSSLRVAIRDNGPGFSPDAQRSLFRAFHTTKTHGIGLGLATARRIVEAHGGTIAIGEATGSGAEIIMTLPRDQ